MTPSLAKRVTATLIPFSLIPNSFAARIISLIEIILPSEASNRSVIKVRALIFCVVISFPDRKI
ncbi:Uncharacterised protein [Acinetobacter baumannii]|nr:Uncharacterised protein [Acinetobacter baumannii]